MMQSALRKSATADEREKAKTTGALRVAALEAERKRHSEDKIKGKEMCDAEKIEKSENSEEQKRIQKRKEKKKQRKRNQKAKGKGNPMCDSTKIELMSQDYEDQNKGKEGDEGRAGCDEAEECGTNAEKFKDPLAFKYKSYKQFWDEVYARSHGRFEDNTMIPCKRLTFKPLPFDASISDTMEVFSVKVAEISGGLLWPLDIYGVVALRDSTDQNRNVIFNRERHSCQTLTSQDPYLLLTGPMRAAILCDPVIIEASLHVRGTTESDDKEFSLLATAFYDGSMSRASYFCMESYTSRLSTLEFGLGFIVMSVEATVSVKVSSGSWPNGFCGRFMAFTDSINKEILLLDSGDKEVPLTGDDVNLSRRVVSVEIFGNLRVSVSASDGNVTLSGGVEFKPQEAGTSSKEFPLDGLCPLEVTVAWSLFSSLPANEV